MERGFPPTGVPGMLQSVRSRPLELASLASASLVRWCLRRSTSTEAV